jgi:Asp-tRNA(Asn)/Glu-tRNA(Gln) amidotransferase A subunit family amidase
VNKKTTRRTLLKSVAAGVSVYAMGAKLSTSWAAAPGDNAGLIELTAQAAVDHIRNGDLKAERYVQALLAQYNAHKSLNTASYIDEAKVLEAARGVDQARGKGAQLGRLAGLPMMFKDNMNTVGFATTAGSPFLKDYRPKANAPLVELLYKHGAIMFAKSNMHELAIGSTSANHTFGFVKNPYDQARHPGGSSGGTAAALAARIVPVGWGTDTSGSCRMPAHFTGTVGFRPSNPEKNPPYSSDGIVPNVLDYDVPGPLARTVGDIALIHAAVTGEGIATAPDLRGVRIGVPRAYFWENIHPAVLKVNEAALEKLRAAGAVLVEVDFSALAKASLPVISALNNEGKRVDIAAFLAREYPSMSIKEAIAGIASKVVRERMEMAVSKPMPAEVIQKARAERVRLTAQYLDLFKQSNIAAIAFPTVPLPATQIPKDGDTLEAIEFGGRKHEARTLILQNVLPGPLYRAPGLSIPSGLTPEGLPVGFELDGLPGDDTRLLGVGLAVEKVLGPVPAPKLRAG